MTRRTKKNSSVKLGVTVGVALLAFVYFVSRGRKPAVESEHASLLPETSDTSALESAAHTTAAETNIITLAPPSEVRSGIRIPNQGANKPEAKEAKLMPGFRRVSPDELPPDLRAQLLGPKPELPEDLKAQLEAPPPDLPPDLAAQLAAPPPELPDDIKRALATPPRIVTAEEVNNPNFLGGTVPQQDFRQE